MINRKTHKLQQWLWSDKRTKVSFWLNDTGMRKSHSPSKVKVYCNRLMTVQLLFTIGNENNYTTILNKLVIINKHEAPKDLIKWFWNKRNEIYGISRRNAHAYPWNLHIKNELILYEDVLICLKAWRMYRKYVLFESLNLY